MTNFSGVYIFLADYLIFLLFSAAILLRFLGLRLPIIKSFATAALAGVLATFIKDFFYVPRPFIFSGNLPLINLIMDGSFPSTHTAISFALGFSVFLKNRLWGGVFLITAVLVAVGRKASGVHTYWDLAGGILLAALCTLIVTKGLTIYHSRC